MALDYIIPEFEVVRNDARCTRCRICESQCANGVHTYNADGKVMVSDESKCVNCQRCVSFCPTHAIKIVKSDNCLRENANWSCATIKEIYKQASTGGVLLSSMGNPQPLPVYWDRILINASQVTNPPIDPLREPMETRVFLGKKPETVRRMDGFAQAHGLVTDITAERHHHEIYLSDARKCAPERLKTVIRHPVRGVG